MISTDYVPYTWEERQFCNIVSWMIPNKVSASGAPLNIQFTDAELMNFYVYTNFWQLNFT